MTDNPSTGTATIRDVIEHGTPDGWAVNITATIDQITERRTTQGRPWVSADVTDATGTVQVLIFPNTFAKLHDSLTEGALITLPCVTQGTHQDWMLCVADPSKPCPLGLRDYAEERLHLTPPEAAR